MLSFFQILETFIIAETCLPFFFFFSNSGNIHYSWNMLTFFFFSNSRNIHHSWNKFLSHVPQDWTFLAGRKMTCLLTGQFINHTWIYLTCEVCQHLYWVKSLSKSHIHYIIISDVEKDLMLLCLVPRLAISRYSLINVKDWLLSGVMICRYHFMHTIYSFVV